MDTIPASLTKKELVEKIKTLQDRIGAIEEAFESSGYGVMSLSDAAEIEELSTRMTLLQWWLESFHASRRKEIPF